MGRLITGRHQALKKIILVAAAFLFAMIPLMILTFKSDSATLSNKICASDTAAVAEADPDNGGKQKSQAAINSPRSGDAVIEATTRHIIGGKNYDAKLPMASTTKIITAALAVNSGKLDDIVVIPKKACGVEGSSIYLKAGEKIKLRDLVYGLMLRSGNDAATAIALYLGGSIENFAAMMNGYARDCGAENTNFVNPHGLHDENHYTTAFDLAVMTAKAMENEEFRKIVACKNYKIESEGEEPRYIANKNKMLSMYDGAIGVKTGYTKAAGRCLVSAGERNGVTVISVVLNEPDMWNKSAENLNLGFDTAKKIRLAEADAELGEFYFKKAKKIIKVGLNEAVDYICFDKTVDIRYETELNSVDKKVKIGDCVGKIKFYDSNRLIFEKNLYSIEIYDAVN